MNSVVWLADNGNFYKMENGKIVLYYETTSWKTSPEENIRIIIRRLFNPDKKRLKI